MLSTFLMTNNKPWKWRSLGLSLKRSPIANDRIGAQIARFKQGYITFDEFLSRIQYLKGITFQYAFCTQKAVDKLIKIK